MKQLFYTVCIALCFTLSLELADHLVDNFQIYRDQNEWLKLILTAASSLGFWGIGDTVLLYFGKHYNKIMNKE